MRAAGAHDRDAVRLMNDAATPHVNALTQEQFDWIIGHADYFRVAELDGVVAGFVIAIRNGTEYWSGNYAWFGERYAEFIYLDRVVVAPSARERGVGRALYEDLITFSTGRWPRIVLEVNVQPPNPVSITFHERMAFERVGARSYPGGEVAMFERTLSVT